MNISTILLEIEHFLLQNKHRNINLLWFKRGAYLILLVKMLSIWSSLDMTYHYAIEVRGLSSNFSVSSFIFWAGSTPFLNFFWGLCCLIVVFGIFSRTKYWLSAIVYLISLNYLNLVYATQNGGDIYLNLFLFILVFFNENKTQNDKAQLLNGAVFYFIMLCVSGIYFINGYVKILNPDWRDGSFLNGVWNLKYFANPNLIPSWFFNPLMMVLTAWSVILFEIAFPFVLMFKRLRIWLVFLGLIFHIFIGLLLSLVSFAAVMMLPYLLLINKHGKCRSLKEI
jgi:hypothetical protein